MTRSSDVYRVVSGETLWRSVNRVKTGFARSIQFWSMNLMMNDDQQTAAASSSPRSIYCNLYCFTDYSNFRNETTFRWMTMDAKWHFRKLTHCWLPIFFSAEQRITDFMCSTVFGFREIFVSNYCYACVRFFHTLRHDAIMPLLFRMPFRPGRTLPTVLTPYDARGTCWEWGRKYENQRLTSESLASNQQIDFHCVQVCMCYDLENDYYSNSRTAALRFISHVKLSQKSIFTILSQCVCVLVSNDYGDGGGDNNMHK